jgi:hypothetical protein
MLQPVFRYLYGIEHGAWARGASSCYCVLSALLFPSLSRLGGIGKRKRTQTSQPTGTASASTVYTVHCASACKDMLQNNPNHHRNHHTMRQDKPRSFRYQPHAQFILPSRSRDPPSSRTCTTLPPMSPVTCPRGCLSIRNNLSVNFSPPSPLHRPTTPPPCRSRRD